VPLISPRLLLIANGDTQIKVYDGATYALLQTLNGSGTLRRAIYDQAHRRIYGLNTSGVIDYWDDTSYAHATIAVPVGFVPVSIACSWASRRLYVGGSGGGHTGVLVYSTNTHTLAADLALVSLAGGADNSRYVYVDNDTDQLWCNGSTHLSHLITGGVNDNGVTVYNIDCATGATLQRLYDFRFDTTICVCFDFQHRKAYFLGYDDANGPGAANRGFLWTIDTLAHTAVLLDPIPTNVHFAGGQPRSWWGVNHNTDDLTIGPGRWKYVLYEPMQGQLVVGGLFFDTGGNYIFDAAALIGGPPHALAYQNGKIVAVSGSGFNPDAIFELDPVTHVGTYTGHTAVGAYGGGGSEGGGGLLFGGDLFPVGPGAPPSSPGPLPQRPQKALGVMVDMSALRSDGTIDLDPGLALVADAQLMNEAVIKRITTPRGGLFYDPDYGVDVREYLNAPIDDARLFELQGLIEAELEKDERISSAAAVLSFDPPRACC
jgi:hypothetical protein